MGEALQLPIEYDVKGAVISELKTKYGGIKIVDTASYKTVIARIVDEIREDVEDL
jgi:hypothetical protein